MDNGLTRRGDRRGTDNVPPGVVRLALRFYGDGLRCGGGRASAAEVVAIASWAGQGARGGREESPSRRF